MKVILFFILMLMSSASFSASCCGGGSSFPSVITGDYRAQFSLAISNSAVNGEVDSQDTYLKRYGDFKEVNEVINLSYAYAWDNAFQVGVSFPIIKNTKVMGDIRESNTGLGDPSFLGTYEFLPEVGYSYLKPRGFIYVKTNLALSPSTYNAQEIYRTDSRGAGRHSLSLGLIFSKIINRHDFQLLIEGHYNLKNEFEKGLVIEDSLGSSALIGYGYNFLKSDIRLGLSLSPKMENEIEFEGGGSKTKPRSLVWNTNFMVSYAYAEYSFNFSYSDQNLVGPMKNTSLSRTLSLNILKFWNL